MAGDNEGSWICKICCKDCGSRKKMKTHFKNDHMSSAGQEGAVQEEAVADEESGAVPAPTQPAAASSEVSEGNQISLILPSVPPPSVPAPSVPAPSVLQPSIPPPSNALPSDPQPPSPGVADLEMTVTAMDEEMLMMEVSEMEDNVELEDELDLPSLNLSSEVTDKTTM